MSVWIIEQRIEAGSQLDGSSGASTGSITTVAGSALSEGESFYLKDLVDGADIQFKFVTRAFPPKKALWPVVFSASDTADQIKAKIIAAINACRHLNLLASDGGASTVNLTNRLGGTAGNATPKADEVSDAGFVVSAMSGGANRASYDVGGTRIFLPNTVGGQFDFPNVIPQQPNKGQPVEGGVLTWQITRVYLNPGGATGWTMDLVTPEGDIIELAAGSAGSVIEGPFSLGWKDRFRITTTGATTAVLARVWGRPEERLPPASQSLLLE